jgi:coenzyme F420-dependent glucose-6-phosphate dehydrogenase
MAPKENPSKQKIGYWAAQEQYSMHDLLKFVIEAEKGGFGTCLTSDHFHPWHHDGGYSNFTWIWMAVAAMRTKSMQFITGVTAPIYRYNPGIVAQAFASLDVLYPNRIGLGIGTGEAMNEVPLGFDWPSPKTRLHRTIDAIQIIKKLWQVDVKEKRLNDHYNDNPAYDFANHVGRYFQIKNAKLYTPPVSRIPLYMAASGKRAAEVAGRYTDGIITNIKPEESTEILQSFDNGALQEGKDATSLEKITKPKVSYSDDYEKALRSAEFWRVSSLESAFNSNISDPRILQKKAEAEVSDESLKQSVLIITSIEECIKPIEELFKVGYTRVYVHSTSPDEIMYIRDFSKKVLPYFNDVFRANRTP